MTKENNWKFIEQIGWWRKTTKSVEGNVFFRFFLSAIASLRSTVARACVIKECLLYCTIVNGEYIIVIIRIIHSKDCTTKQHCHTCTEKGIKYVSPDKSKNAWSICIGYDDRGFSKFILTTVIFDNGLRVNVKVIRGPTPWPL